MQAQVSKTLLFLKGSIKTFLCKWCVIIFLPPGGIVMCSEILQWVGDPKRRINYGLFWVWKEWNDEKVKQERLFTFPVFLSPNVLHHLVWFLCFLQKLQQVACWELGGQKHLILFEHCVLLFEDLFKTCPNVVIKIKLLQQFSWLYAMS